MVHIKTLSNVVFKYPFLCGGLRLLSSATSNLDDKRRKQHYKTVMYYETFYYGIDTKMSTLHYSICYYCVITYKLYAIILCYIYK